MSSIVIAHHFRQAKATRNNDSASLCVSLSVCVCKLIFPFADDVNDGYYIIIILFFYYGATVAAAVEEQLDY